MTTPTSDGRPGRQLGVSHWRLALAFIVLLALGATVAVATRNARPPVSPPAAGTGSNPSTTSEPSQSQGQALVERTGLYASAARLPDGSIDIDATIADLRAVGATRYYYLVSDVPATDGIGRGRGEVDWSTLPAFAQAAGHAGIDVVVYLLPPLQSRISTYRPFGWDYRTWLRAVGRVARAEPAVTGVAIDDFAAATDDRTSSKGLPVITPEIIRDGMSQARRESPSLRLYAVTYSQDFAAPTARLAPFRPYLDGVIHAFSGRGNLRHFPQNTTEAHGVAEVSEFVRRTTGCGGESRCHQATFAARPQSGSGSDVVDLRRTLPASSGGDELVVDLTDDLLDRDKEGYAVTVLVDGAPVATRREEGASWPRLVATIPETPNSSVEAVVRVSRAHGSGPFSVWLLPHLRLEDAGAVVSQWTRFGGGGVSGAVVQPLAVVLMAYAAPFGTEKDRVGAAGSAYLRVVADGARSALAAGSIDGLAVYRLNLSGVRNGPLHGDPDNVAVVADLFSRR